VLNKVESQADVENVLKRSSFEIWPKIAEKQSEVDHQVETFKQVKENNTYSVKLFGYLITSVIEKETHIEKLRETSTRPSHDAKALHQPHEGIISWKVQVK